MLDFIRSNVFGRFVLPLVLAVLFFLFFFGGPDYYSSRFFKQFWNLGHILFFAILPLYICMLSKRAKGNLPIQAVIVFGVALFLGAFIELLQGSFQQDVEYGDLIRDLIGGMVGMFFLLPDRQIFPTKVLRWMQIFTICLVIVQIYPAVVALSDEWRARRQFPVLSDFETAFEIERWGGDAGRSISKKDAFHGKRSMMVQLGTGTYSGVSLNYFPGDWTGFRGFEFSVFNPDPEEIRLTCRIHDKRHVAGGEELFGDRFNRTYSLGPGWHTIRIAADDILHAPEGRVMDVRHILGVGIFATRLPRPRVLYIDYVRVLF